MKEYSITVSGTKNPTIIKFEANHILAHRKNYEFKNIDDAKNSPLAQQLFHLPFVKTIYISGNFIGLERYDIVQWEDVKDEVAQQLVEYLNSGEPVVIEEDNGKPISVTVYAEVTPNPSTMKFVASKKIVAAAFEFKNIDEARVSPLAMDLFQFPFVKQVFLDDNYVSVSKYEVAEWEDITIEVKELIRNFIADGKEIVSDQAKAVNAVEPQSAKAEEHPVDLDDISLEIIDILEEYVKPAVARDGGNILFKSYEPDTKRVNVVLQGACSGCPSSTYTLKSGIETMLKNMMGDKVNEVVAMNG
jgi:Fe-S cluster biogenesis protein NfuA